jgi:uncharacterized protein (DUF2141 family)
VSVLHDEKSKQGLTQGRLGIPKEGFGFSNNVVGALGPRSFRKAPFNVPVGDSFVTTALKYKTK